jgi:hypothetical protein
MTGIPGDLCTCIFDPTIQLLARVLLPKRDEDGCRESMYPVSFTGITRVF